MKIYKSLGIIEKKSEKAKRVQLFVKKREIKYTNNDITLISYYMPAINLPKIPHTDFYIGSNKLEIVTTNTDAKTLEFTKTTTAKVQNLVTPEIGGFPKEIHPGIIEHDDHFEINGYMVSKENYKKPLCPKIEINYSQASPTIPQAWSEFFNGEILWFYNWEGAKVEAAYR